MASASSDVPPTPIGSRRPGSASRALPRPPTYLAAGSELTEEHIRRAIAALEANARRLREQGPPPDPYHEELRRRAIARFADGSLVTHREGDPADALDGGHYTTLMAPAAFADLRAIEAFRESIAGYPRWARWLAWRVRDLDQISEALWRCATYTVIVAFFTLLSTLLALALTRP